MLANVEHKLRFVICKMPFSHNRYKPDRTSVANLEFKVIRRLPDRRSPLRKNSTIAGPHNTAVTVRMERVDKRTHAKMIVALKESTDCRVHPHRLYICASTSAFSSTA